MKEIQKSLFDFHLHTERSPDASSTPEQIVQVAKEKGLAGFIKSDHDSNRKDDFVKLNELAEAHGLIVIPGAEVTCLPPDIDKFFSISKIKSLRPRNPQFVRHLIVAGVPPEKSIPLFRRTPQMIATWAHDEGGIVIAAHPKKHGGASSLSEQEIFSLASHLDGLEVANPLGINHEAIVWAKELELAQVGGSDSHKHPTIGIAVTELPGKYTGWQEVIASVRDKTTSVSLSSDFSDYTDTKSLRADLWKWTTKNLL